MGALKSSIGKRLTNATSGLMAKKQPRYSFDRLTFGRAEEQYWRLVSLRHLVSWKAVSNAPAPQYFTFRCFSVRCERIELAADNIRPARDMIFLAVLVCTVISILIDYPLQ